MPSSVQTILIGTTLTDASDRVVRDGLRVARAAGARVHLVHVFQAPLAYSGGIPYGTPVYIPELIDAKRESRRSRLDAQVARLGIRPEELAGSSVLEGAPHFVLAETAAATAADLIVVAASEGGGRLAKLLGSTAGRLARVASCPVLVIRGQLAVPPRHVLVGVDLSQISGEALARGLEIVGCLGSPAAVAGTAGAAWRGPGQPGLAQALLVVESEPPLDEIPGPEQVPIDEAIREAFDQFMAENCPPSWRVTPLIRTGTSIAGKILEMSEDLEADLVVLGSHGRHALSRMLLLGSVAETVLRNSSQSVLLVPPAVPPTSRAAASIAEVAGAQAW
jgi:nucleotide-binding universal stress UspA family protein